MSGESKKNKKVTKQETYNERLINGIKSQDKKEIKICLDILGKNYTDDNEHNALHLAAIHGKPGLIPFLIELSVKVNQPDNDGYTPLHLAIQLNKPLCTGKLLLDHRVSTNTKNNNAETILDTAIENENTEILEALLNRDRKIIKNLYPEGKRDNIYKTILKLTLKNDNLEVFKIIMLQYGPINRELLENFQENSKIKKLLDYRPGKKYENIKHHLCNSYSSQLLEDMLYDEANSSDEESSDSEIDEYHSLKKNTDKESKILARGFHLSPTHFSDTAKRREAISSSHDQPIYSLATSSMAQEGKTLKRADELVKAYFELLKITPDKHELTEKYTKRKRKVNDEEKHFDSLYHKFIHTYVNPHGYSELFNKGGAQRNFNFFSNNNPTLSTTPDFVVAASYASGERITDVSRFFPKVRKSTGKLKHRRLGYVEVYAISKEYYKNHAIDVDQLKKDEKISIAHNQSFNKEVIVESSIPKEFILGYQIFSLPSFKHEWSRQIEEQYGLNKTSYDIWRKKLRNDWKDSQNNMKELISVVTAWQANKMKATIDKNLSCSRNKEPEKNPELSPGSTKSFSR